ncbi:MAG: sigma-70 family RNA polymerase sigma factor [Bacteroidaceae bacterium]|nr:sigma-70 family RNA polymerase sigma factor [Bacteroidaceae bacterium]
MTDTIPLQDQDLDRFLVKEKGKVLAYLRKKFSLLDDDLDDIYQESSMALFLNIQEGKLTNLTSTLSTYFLRICINQALKFIGKQQKVVPLFDDSSITNKDEFRSDKIDELYRLCTEDEDAERVALSERMVQNIIEVMPDTCKNIFQGYYWDNLTTSTIADMFGFANANSVKAQKYKCIQKFRNKYNELMNRNNGQG